MKKLLKRISQNTTTLRMSPALILMSALLFGPVSNSFSQDTPPANGPAFMEAVWFSTDRSIYIPGEDIEFSAIVLEKDTYTPSQLSSILRVELFDKDGRHFVQEEFMLDEGRINQNISIPTALPGGWYYIRAYTNWMRNDSEEINNFYPIKIINPEKIVLASTANISSYVASVVSENENLVGGMLNNCSVRIESQSGKKAAINAALLTGSNDTITTFVTDNTGWGNFSFVPSDLYEYRIVSTSGEAISIQTIMPEIVRDVPFTTFNEEGSNIRLSITNANSDVVKLLVHGSYSWYDYQVAQTMNGSALFSVPAYLIPGGIVQFSLLSSDNKVLFTRLHMNNGLGLDPGIKLKPSAENNNIVDAEVIINAAGRSGNQLLNTIVSIEEPYDIFDDYMAGSPGWSFSYDIPVRPEALRGWLLAKSYNNEILQAFFNSSGTELVSWSGISSLTLNEIEMQYEFLPETRGYTLNGKVVDEFARPVKDQVISATLLSDNSFFTGPTFDSGKFHLVFSDRKGFEDAVVSFTSKPEGDWNLIIDPQYDTAPLSLPKNPFSVTREEAEFVRKLDVNRQLDLIYSDISETANNTESAKTNYQESFFGIPDKVTTVDDFISLSNIREVLFEVVPRVVARKSGDSWRLSIVGDPPLPISQKPLFLLDGIPLLEFNKFLEFPPERLMEIELISHLYVHGNTSFSGIVSFHTVNKDLAGLELPAKSHLLSIKMPEFSTLRSYSLNKEKTDFLPQLNTTLYWIPFTTSALSRFSFSPGDVEGTYASKVCGFNANGQWLYSKKTITFGTDVAKDDE